MLTRIVAITLLCAFPAIAAHGEPASARYAPAQLHMAEAELDHAREARARGDLHLAERLTVQAGLDAWLAWSMSESVPLRREALEVLRDAAALRRSLMKK